MQDKTAAKTLYGLPIRDVTTYCSLGFHMSYVSNRDEHACFKLDNSVVAKKKVIWSFALPDSLIFSCLAFTGNSECVLLRFHCYLHISADELQVLLHKFEKFSKLLIQSETRSFCGKWKKYRAVASLQIRYLPSQAIQDA